MRILGIDPGSHATGYGVIERDGGRLVHVAHGTLRPRRDGSLERRLDELYRGVLEIVRHHAPDVAAVERVFVAANPRSALVLGQARGAVLAALGAAGLGVTEYATAELKLSLTGNGRAEKRQVQLVVRRLLALAQMPQPDAADALAAALGHAQAGSLRALGVVARRRAARPRAGLARLRVRRLV